MKTYYGNRKEGNPIVSVEEDGEERGLDARFDLVTHSPTGFEWGYHGSGPAQLALAILADCTDDETAKRFYQDFKHEVIAGTTGDSWSIPVEEIEEWLTMKEEATLSGN